MASASMYELYKIRGPELTQTRQTISVIITAKYDKYYQG